MKKKVKKKKTEMPSGEGGRQSTSTNPFTDEFNQMKPGDNQGNGELPLTQLPVNRQIMGQFNKITSRRILRKQALWDMPGAVVGLEDTRNMGTDRGQGNMSPFRGGGEIPSSMLQDLSEKKWQQLYDRFIRTMKIKKRKPNGGNNEESIDVIDSGQAPSSEDVNP